MNEVIKARIELLKTFHNNIMNLDDEEAYYGWWIIEGVPDEPTEDDFEFIASNDDEFNEVVALYDKIMEEYGGE